MKKNDEVDRGGRGPERELRDSGAGSEAKLPPLTRRATSEGKTSQSGAALWIGVGVVFALMALAWTAMFFFSSKFRAESVPVETRKEAR